MAPIRLSAPENVELRRQLRVQGLIDHGFIRPSTSPYAAPVFFVKKPGETKLRLVADWRGLNDITVKNRLALPNLEELFNQLQSAKYFSKLDLHSGFNQVRIAEEDIPKTAITTRFGHYEFLVMHFGLTNGPATFQTLMHRVLQQFLGKCVVVFIDDVLIFSQTREQHLEHLEQVFSTLRRSSLYCKPSKCVFMGTSITFLGHRFNNGTIAVDPTKTSVVQDWPRPLDVASVRRFVGLVNFFRRFIPHFADIAAPLNDLLKKGKRFEWLALHQTAFDNLKHLLISPPVLLLPDWTKPFVVTADASDVATGAVLTQGGRPVAYMSAKLSPAEKNYTADERETLAVVTAFRAWRQYLFLPFVLETDSQVVAHLLTKRGELTQRQQRWVEKMVDFNFTVRQVRSKDNMADPLSRTTVLNQQEIAHDAAVHLLSFTTWDPVILEDVRAGYESDPAAMKIIQRISASEGAEAHTLAPNAESESSATNALSRVDSEYRMQKGLLLVERKGTVRIYVPSVGDLRVRILAMLHESPMAGHPGRDRMLALIQQSVYWPKIQKDVKLFVSSCDACQRDKSLNRKAAAEIHPLDIPTQRWTDQAMDFLTGLPESDGADAILTVVDRATHRVHFIPCNKDITARQTAQLYVDHIVRLHGLPLSIVSDRDKLFTSMFWKELMTILGVQLRFSTANHPQTDGASERMHRSLLEMLRTFVHHNQKDWRNRLSMCEFALNNLKNASTGVSAFFADLGLHPITAFPQALAITQQPSPDREIVGLPISVSEARLFAQQQQQILDLVHDTMLETQERMHKEQVVDNARKASKISAGDLVLVSSQALLSPAQRDRPSNKLSYRWQGPFTVLECLSDAAFKLDLQGIKAHPVINVSFLRRYVSPSVIPHREPPPPEPVLGTGNEPEWEVEEILAHKRSKHKKPRWMFTLKWKGLGVAHNSVEPLSSLVDTNTQSQIVSVTEALADYARRHEDVWNELLAQGWVPDAH